MNTAAEFWSRVSLGDECWEWLGAVRNKGGYGSVHWNGKTEFAHRVGFLLAKGEIPDGLVLDHLCRNRMCCRPDHLEAVTPSLNVRRGIRPAQAAAEMKQRAKRRTHCKNGHPWETNERTPEGGSRYCLTCRRELAQKYRREKSTK